jgi:HEAT repeat protein
VDPSRGPDGGGPGVRRRARRAGGQPATELDPAEVDRRLAVALAGHRGGVDEATAALADPSASVRATALGALDRLGTLTDAQVRGALADPDAGVRRRGCELAAGRPRITLVALLADADDTVVEMAAWALGEQGDASAVGALSRLAAPGGGHRDPLCREAAVAALGAIGDEAGLPAVLAALDDKPAVRRRAAAALAAFEGEEVAAALRRCLEDRDWQVRQVAEDLVAGSD